MIALYGSRTYRSPSIPGKTEGLALFGEHENDDVNNKNGSDVANQQPSFDAI